MSWKQHFETLSDHAIGRLQDGEDALLWLQAEQSDFVRFNRGRVRQPGSVHQAELRLRLLRGRRHAAVDLTLGGEDILDRAQVDGALAELRSMVAEIPEDPHLLWAEDGPSVCTEVPGEVPDARAITEAVVREGEGQDLVGVLISGELMAGMASSRGQRCWDRRQSTIIDWCLYHQGDKAVKSTVDGTDWDPDAFARHMAHARSRLEALARPTKDLSPGRYRVYLAPAAMSEVFGLLSWGSFGRRALETRTTTLLRLASGDARLSEQVHLAEDTAHGLGPAFTPEGFTKPDRVPLVEGGRLVGSLASPRSAMEYGVDNHGADESEGPMALSMTPGDLAESDVLERLGTGLYVSNLWYLNYSDRPMGRITGMTRFATMWVEDGVVQGPAEVMRFDETLYHLLGAGLEAISDRAELLPSTDTYERRSAASMRLPGALVDGVTFTL